MRNCVDEGALQAWFDRELAAHEAADLVAHLNECVQCADAARTVEAENLILSEGLSTEFSAAIPTERLRQRVNAAVESFDVATAPAVSESFTRSLADVFSWFRPLAYASVAAIVLLAGFLAFIYFKKEKATPVFVKDDRHQVTPPAPKLADDRPTKPVPSQSPQLVLVRHPHPPRRSSASEPDARSLSWQERQYEYAIAKLNEAIRIQPALRPALQVEYEYNMALIDNAIATGRDAARRNPKDPQATQPLLVAYQSKVDLMNQIADARSLER